ncbi:glucosamine-6-phosphate deaminase [Psychrobacillus sp. INOP01]|uniref:6-phosphogluconolactonase n=1 Tax=Psychrobacillus sp. INOP01 TaxID=2829187 RepID=UPI001BA5CFBD|nr:glucosamine-6-phosphate deaminase [Psychrobacillus sp. INOP01]QUG40687.1 glucosamine-6-phosphate deaminase [Psychrobacillus sp. INOP01]
MKINIYPTAEEADYAAALRFTEIVKSVIKPKIGLATGTTPIGFYAQLVKFYQKGVLSFKDMTTYNLDEYIGLSPDHPQSFAAFMDNHLFSAIDLPAAQRNIPHGDTADSHLEAERYNSLVEGNSPLDLQLMSIGLNGHIGFNEPGETLSTSAHLVHLTEETREVNKKSFTQGEVVPSSAITLGLGAIMKAKRILFLAKGDEKAEILKQAFEGPLTTKVPGSFLQLHPHMEVFLDKDAAKYLTVNINVVT